ncbi:MAG: hypothetical protein L3K09_05345 [Thermoplasmata archaeon]|nr:hypothetical protein [Thermoplasmata archaeon]
MSRSTFLFLLSLLSFLLFLALEPLLGFSLFGSDTGEYYRLTAGLVGTGHIPTGSAYGGWGFGYPDFPGTFLLAGASAGALGLDPLSALTWVVPSVAVLSVLPLFLLFRRVFPSDAVALLGAAFASVAMPRLFSIAHPAPLALGDFLVVAGLWMFIEGRREIRWYFPLALVGASLIVTHHLSSYFFLVSAAGSLLLYELVRPGLWSRRFPARELAFLAAFSVGLFAYWFEYARSFATILPEGTAGIVSVSLGGFIAGALVGLLAVGWIIRWRRSRGSTRVGWVRFPTDFSVARDTAILLVGAFGAAAALLFVYLPGTSQSTTSGAILYYTPVLLIGAFAAGSRRLFSESRMGLYAHSWLGAIGLSAAFGILSNSAVILPSRHAEYLLIPIGLLAALGAGRLIARLGDERGRRAMWAGALGVVVLIAANAAIAYPPPADLVGFQEGLTHQDAALWMWVGVGVPGWAVVASDHRLSSMIFGFDGNRATWDSTPSLFLGSSRSAMLSELNGSLAPHGTPRPVNAVAIDQTMYGGVALDPSQGASPLSAAAKAWFGAPPFVPLYENGPQAVYWVVAPGSSAT